MGLLDDAIREHLDLKRRRGADPTEIERAEQEALGPVRREPSMSAAYVEEGAAAALTDAPANDFAFGTDVGEFAGEAPTTITAPDDDSAPAIASPAYANPAFDDFAAVEPPAPTGLELEPLAPMGLEPEPRSEAEPRFESEPKPKRRHLFGRHRHDEVERTGGRQELAAGTLPDDEFDDDMPAASSERTGVGRTQPIGRDQSLPPAEPPPTLLITSDAEPGNTIEYDVEQAFLEEDKVEPAGGEDILEETPDFLADTPDHDRLWFEQKPPPDFDFDN
jgi:hypothetical protein